MAALPRTLAASAAQFLVATFARSYKEGQTYMQLLVMRPLLPGLWLALMPVQGQGGMFGVPLGPLPLLLGWACRAGGAGRPDGHRPAAGQRAQHLRPLLMRGQRPWAGV